MAAKTAKGYKGVAMEGFIATWYAKITQKNMEEFRSDARKIAAEMAAGAAILEVAPGPGYLAIELARLGKYQVTGLDISKKFVEIAQAKAREEGVSLDFRNGDVAHMPFDDDTFDFITCRAAFKNFSEPILALNEMYRVLKSGGKASILDLRADAPAKTVNEYVDTMGLNRINTFITRWTFKNMLLKRAYTQEQFRAFAAQSEFKTCEIQEDAIGMEVRLNKR